MDEAKALALTIGQSVSTARHRQPSRLFRHL